MTEYDPNADADGLLLGETTKRGFVRGVQGVDKFSVREVEYAEVDGEAVFEGCIVLGTTDEMTALTAEIEAEGGIVLVNAVEAFGITVLPRLLWTHGIVPYRIAAGLPDQQRVSDAIAHWEARTGIRFVERTDETDFVTFRPASGCSARVGCAGGEQFVNLGPNCSTGNTIHEIGHTVGLWHEQSRSDRGDFIEVRYQNIRLSARHNFNQHIHDGIDRGPYDYGSIMHYRGDAFSVNGEPTIVARDGSQIGQRAALSTGDVAAVQEAYAHEFANRDNG
jgi:astacin